jgi:hypothetical protein
MSKKKKYYPCKLSKDKDFPKTIYRVFVDVGENADCDDIFESESNYANGYAWREIIKFALNEFKISFVADIQFDCSADEFFVFTYDKKDQKKLALLFSELYCDEKKLRFILRQIPPNKRYSE